MVRELRWAVEQRVTLENWVELFGLGLALWIAKQSIPVELDLDWNALFAALVRPGDGAGAASVDLAEVPWHLLGSGGTHETVAAWADPVRNGIARHFDSVACVGVDTEWAGDLGQAVPGIRTARLSSRSAASGEAGDAELADALLAHTPQAKDRLVVVTQGEGVHPLLRSLHLRPDLRDRVVAVVAMGGVVRGEELDAWLDAHFDHVSMDTEMKRATPYVAIVDSDGPSPELQRFPHPVEPRSGWVSVDPIDLGPVALSELQPSMVARALWVVLAFRVGVN